MLGAEGKVWPLLIRSDKEERATGPGCLLANGRRKPNRIPVEGETWDRIRAEQSRTTPYPRLCFHISTTELRFFFERGRPHHPVAHLSSSCAGSAVRRKDGEPSLPSEI